MYYFYHSPSFRQITCLSSKMETKMAYIINGERLGQYQLYKQYENSCHYLWLCANRKSLTTKYSGRLLAFFSPCGCGGTM